MTKEPDDAARAQAVARLAKFREVDILVLFECAISSDELLHALKAEDPQLLDRFDDSGSNRRRRSSFSQGREALAHRAFRSFSNPL